MEQYINLWKTKNKWYANHIQVFWILNTKGRMRNLCAFERIDKYKEQKDYLFSFKQKKNMPTVW